jgi:hypothetical protein
MSRDNLDRIINIGAAVVSTFAALLVLAGFVRLTLWDASYMPLLLVEAAVIAGGFVLLLRHRESH